MDIQTFLAVAGITATIILGIWAIVITVRHNRGVQITYAHDQAIALTDDITQNFPDLKVLFRDQPVSENLVLLKGYFINTGKKDISREMTEQQITLKLPSEFEWVESKVVECSPTLKATARVNGKTEISFETGLWKIREYFKFEALAKVPVVKADPDNLPKEYPTRRLVQAVTFSHRIADSKVIHETRVPRVPPRTGSLRFLGFPRRVAMSSRAALVAAAVITVLGASIWVAGHFLADTGIGYRVTIDGQERVLSARVKQSKVLLSDRKGFKREYTLPEFDNLPDKRTEFVSMSDQFPRIFGATYSCMGVLMFVIFATKGVRERRLLSIITDKEKT